MQNIDNSAPVTDTTVGVIAYITLIGFIIALIMNGDKKGETKSFGAFHLRQSLGLIITAFGLMIGMMILIGIMMVISSVLSAMISMIIYPIVSLGVLAMLIIGIINAANGEKKELPVIGPIISKTLGKTFE